MQMPRSLSASRGLCTQGSVQDRVGETHREGQAEDCGIWSWRITEHSREDQGSGGAGEVEMWSKASVRMGQQPGKPFFLSSGTEWM